MKHKVCFLVIALMAIFARAQAVERPGTITLKQEEVAEILAAQESYAYFGQEICSLSSDLAALCTMARDAKLEAKHLAALHELAAQGYMTAPASMVKAAVEEAAQCLATCKANMTADMARMAAALEAYDHALQTGAAEVVIASDFAEATTDRDSDDSSAAQTRGTKRFDNLVVHSQANIGALYVGGDTIINHNLTVGGNETVQGNLTVNGATIFTSTAAVVFAGSQTINGNLTVTGNSILGTCPTSINTIQGTTNINTACSATTTIGTGGTGAVNIGNATGNTAVTGNETVSGNIILPVATTGAIGAGTVGLLELGGASDATNVSLFEVGTGNLFAGNYTTVPAVTGTNNISIGTSANTTLTTANNTIAIGNTASATLPNSIAIGGSVIATTTGTFIGNIFGAQTAAGALPVFCDATNHLGTQQSSRRFKENFRNLDAHSAQIYNLNPVKFDYKASSGGAKDQFGLIAEEVHKVLPEIVVHDEHGEIYSVQYHILPTLLLNEIKHLAARVATLEAALIKLK